ncbi:MAG: hypothetical protein ABW034_04165 [Steroidobacteraceae bacterium]
MSEHPRSPIIHIGYHKTGTTWFQQQFYPAVQSGNFLSRSLVREALIAPRAYAFSPERARRQLEEAAGDQRILICEENLSGYVHNGGLGGLLSREMAQRLYRCFPEATIVVFLRAQPSAFEASYSQYVLGGGTHGIERYLLAHENVHGALQYWYKAPLFSWQHFDYGALLDEYCQLFGRNRVHIALYEEFAADNAAFLRGFAATLGLDVNWPALATRTLNRSLSADELAILRRLNVFTERSVLYKKYWLASGWMYKRRWPLLRWLRKVPLSNRCLASVKLSDTLREKIAGHFRRSNTAIAARYDLPLHRYEYPLDTPK